MSNTQKHNHNEAAAAAAVATKGVSSSTITTSPTEPSLYSTVCCGCRPGSKRWKRASLQLKSFRKSRAHYFDTDAGQDDEWDKESLFFFDAEQTPLGEDEYPVTFTNKLQHPKPTVTFEDPESLLRSSTTVVIKNCIQRQESEPIEDHRIQSTRYLKITRRSTMEHAQLLEAPRVKTALQGYPGDLTLDDLAECQKFVRGLKELDPTVSEQIYSMRDIEEAPYTICRWLRATKFDARSILDRCAENQAMFDEAKEHNFHPDVSAAIGAPFTVFLSQYPFLPIGRGKNGCPVNYFQAGQIHPEGIMALTTVKRLTGYFWWSFMYKFKQEIRKAQDRDPDFVRIEGINIIDLKGLSASSLSGDTMEVIKLASKISDFFPETLHCMLVLNAPSFFALSWGIIKKFIDPRTAQRIQVFSNQDKGLKALQQMVDVEQIPVDYGGTNKTVKEAFTLEAADPTLHRQDIALLYVRKKHKASTKEVWALRPDEYMEIRVYTRSVAAANITVKLNGAVFKTVPASCTFENETPMPNCTLVVEKLMGPGKVTMEVEDMDTPMERKHNGLPRGYFLVVGDVKEEKSQS